ncbi:MAG: response regulator transcription factor, partial [Bacteroidota bacterium]|nr:response regulator transcription factor [Bacteroidota bacterium]
MNRSPIRILLADDHELYLDGLKGLFLTQQVYEVVAEAQNGIELVKMAKLYQPQIVLTDLRMPLLSGAKAINKITQASPTCKCLVLTNYENDLSVIEALEAGASGYITKNMPKQQLFTALDQISRGYPYFCQATNAKMIRLIGRSNYNPFSHKYSPKFTDHEK